MVLWFGFEGKSHGAMDQSKRLLISLYIEAKGIWCNMMEKQDLAQNKDVIFIFELCFGIPA